MTTRTTTSSNNHGQDDPTYILAKSYFDLGEYRKVRGFAGDVVGQGVQRGNLEDVSRTVRALLGGRDDEARRGERARERSEWGGWR